MKRQLLFLILSFVILTGKVFAAEVVEFPEEDLARESVSPVFDQHEAVKKRNIRTAGRLEAGIFGGTSLNDPFFNSYPVGGNLSYHFNEVHSFALSGAYVASQQSQYVSQIKSEAGGGAIPFDNAPVPKYYFLGQYEFTAYYGKISFTKQAVSNLALSFTAGLGNINLGTESGFLTEFGMNQRLFLTRRISLRADLMALLYQQKDVVQVTPDKKNIVTFLITGGVQFLF